VVYGNYAGKADGSLPAALLLKLGHDRVAFLDGVGLDEWRNAGYAASNEPQRLPPSTYVAKPRLERLWSYDEVRKNLNNPNVIILDSRSEAEFLGQELRGNKRGGHIPGAQLLSSDDLLDKQSHKTISVEAARSRIEKMLPDKSKTVVVYCQSGTRCSLKELVLKDLGYKNVVLYDGSWQEWSSKEDAPVERP
jgi:thiosulfate/3-mercaptopyruvate sulfurtransferase